MIIGGTMTLRRGVLALAFSMLLGPVALAQGAPGAPKAAPPAPPAPQGIQVPQPEVLLVLIRSALIGLDHANRTGNYSVLRELGGPALQRLSSGQLSTVFANLRANNVDLLAAAILTPQLVEQPAVSPEGILQLAGFFPTQPRRIEFRIVYQPAGGQWKLAGLSVSIPETSA